MANTDKQCPACKKWFMSIGQREHHEQNAERLCPHFQAAWIRGENPIKRRTMAEALEESAQHYYDSGAAFRP